MVNRTELKPRFDLTGKRVLLVEDSFLVASSIVQMLEDLGCRVVGPFATVSDAMGAVTAGSFDAGVLDVNLGNETSEPVAEGLLRRGVPFFFVTGYLSPALINPKFAGFTRVHKPLTTAMLEDALAASMEEGEEEA
jgi:CheY-like chemotaxis protein